MSESLYPDGPITRERHSATPMLHITTKMDGITMVRMDGSSTPSAPGDAMYDIPRGVGERSPIHRAARLSPTRARP